MRQIFLDGEPLTGAQVQQIQDEAVINCADTTERDALPTSVKTAWVNGDLHKRNAGGAWESVVDTIDLSYKANAASPVFTGTPTAPTAAVGTNTTQLATTAFVNAEIANDAPTKTGTGASGTWGIAISGNAATATKLATTRNIALTGDVTGSANFDGSANISITAAVADNSHSHTNYSTTSHTHTRTAAGYNIWSFDAGSLAAGTGYGPWTVSHGLGQTPVVTLAGVQEDDGTGSVFAGIAYNNLTTCSVVARNAGGAAETCKIVGASFK